MTTRYDIENLPGWCKGQISKHVIYRYGRMYNMRNPSDVAELESLEEFSEEKQITETERRDLYGGD